VLADVEQSFLDRGVGTISKNLEREVAKNKLTAEQREKALALIAGTTDRKRLAECDFIVRGGQRAF
jgi:3-hydroxybutyryl-CoA dehydrogenase